jgi:mono/diheme cytochrome c family protein
MRAKRTAPGVALAVVLTMALVAWVPAGGWAVVKVADVPDAWVAGRPLELAWETRQHGVSPLGGLRPAIEARSGTLRIAGTAWEVTERGGRAYRGRIAFPSPGEWQVTIRGGFGSAATTLVPLTVVDTGGPVRGTVAAHLASLGVAPASALERGRRAFAARGCVTCHDHDAVGVTGGMAGVGPDLSGRTWPPEYLARFLADPAIGPGANGRRMPNLALGPSDVALLAAFLNGGGRSASR